MQTKIDQPLLEAKTLRGKLTYCKAIVLSRYRRNRTYEPVKLTLTKSEYIHDCTIEVYLVYLQFDLVMVV